MSRRTAAPLLAAVLLLASCSASGGGSAASTDPTDPGEPTATTDGTGTTGSVPPAEPGELPVPAIEWTDCEGDHECGTVALPLDYDDPDGPTIDIAVSRRPADDPERRIGALFLNPGGPGGSAIELAQSFPSGGDLGDRFDIVGFDPRGVGDSSALACDSHLQEMYDADPTPDSPTEEQAVLDTSQAFVDECEAAYADVLPHLGTGNVARDMDQIRRALGDEQLSYLGFSYGTSLGQEYARLFPTHVRAMVLDGVVDHAPDGIAAAQAQAAGFETALQGYLDDCADDDDCGLGMPADEAIAEVVAAAEAAPIPAPDADRPATPGVVSLALARALYAEVLWGQLSSALRDGLDGDGSGLVQLADDYLGGDGEGGYDGGFEVYFGVSCLDDTWPDDPGAFFDAATDAEAATPLFGGAIVIDYIRCALWPAEAEPLAPVPADTEGLPPIVVISTTGDPATPYENGVAVAEQIPGAVLVTNEGEGHTVVAQGKPCIDDLFLAYLVELEVPEDDTTCS